MKLICETRMLYNTVKSVNKNDGWKDMKETINEEIYVYMMLLIMIIIQYSGKYNNNNQLINDKKRFIM